MDRVEASTEGASRLTLLHNDLKPTNIRLLPGDRVKVLDFGAAKALSLSRRVTRNDFGSIAYLSPECLDTGERDRRSDAWALGVLLYEMVTGRPPFRAADTARLERLIRSRQPPAVPDDAPPNLQAVIAKLLAASPEDRYEDAVAIRSDLQRVIAGARTVAEDEVDRGAATRRTRGGSDEEAPTRRTRTEVTDEPATRPIGRDRPGAPGDPPLGDPAASSAPASVGLSAPAPGATAPVPVSPWPRRMRLGALILLLLVALNEGCVAMRAQRVAAQVPTLEWAGLTDAFGSYQSLRGRSLMFGAGVLDLREALVRQTKLQAERVIANYRTPQPSVREAQWRAAATGLGRALALAPNDADLRGALRYTEGHLRRIDGEASKSRGEATLAQRGFAEAVTAFREAASLRAKWPDPFLGLARTFIYGMEDIDLGHDAVRQAQRLGYAIGAREAAQLADGYRMRGETLERNARTLAGLPQERDQLIRASEALQRALEFYSQIASVGDTAATIRSTQQRLDRITRTLEDR